MDNNENENEVILASLLLRLFAFAVNIMKYIHLLIDFYWTISVALLHNDNPLGLAAKPVFSTN